MRELIERYVRELVKIPSTSNTETEKSCADYIAEELAKQPYFKEYPEQTGKYLLPEDSFGRSVPWGLVKGRNGSRKTIILTGHYDVVDTEEYGNERALAYDVEKWENLVKSGNALPGMPEEVKEDFLSGEWMFGRGTADMKGGLSVGLALLDWYGKLVVEAERKECGTAAFETKTASGTEETPEISGNLLFVTVPDEEGYSAGMRDAVPFLNDLKERFDLEYTALIDLEPASMENGAKTIYTGSVGKTMPAVLVQGVKAHVLNCFQGVSSVGVLSSFFMKTELAPEFAEKSATEICPPPTWFCLRDRKEGYDVSVPFRAGGYMSMLGFEKTPDEVIKRLKELGKESFEEYARRMEAQWKAVEKAEVPEEKAGLTSEGNPLACPSAAAVAEAEVLTVSELLAYCRKEQGEAFTAWLLEAYKTQKAHLDKGETNFPSATLDFMEQLLNQSGISGPIMILGFAPPFYPAVDSGKEGKILFKEMKKAAEKENVSLKCHEYFCGISDLSYCGGMDKEELAAYAAQTPLWGSAYAMDIEAMAKLKIPSMLFGPWGKDIHTRWERVNKASLYEKTPAVLKNFIEQMFDK